jgi:hypothetical protein
VGASYAHRGGARDYRAYHAYHAYPDATRGMADASRGMGLAAPGPLVSEAPLLVSSNAEVGGGGGHGGGRGVPAVVVGVGMTLEPAEPGAEAYCHVAGFKHGGPVHQVCVCVCACVCCFLVCRCVECMCVLSRVRCAHGRERG